MEPEIIKRFRDKILVRADGHWIWRGNKTDRDYGRIMINGRNLQATRLSWAIAHDKSIDEIEHLRMVKICTEHDCVNPECLVALPKKPFA